MTWSCEGYFIPSWRWKGIIPSITVSNPFESHSHAKSYQETLENALKFTMYKYSLTLNPNQKLKIRNEIQIAYHRNGISIFLPRYFMRHTTTIFGIMRAFLGNTCEKGSRFPRNTKSRLCFKQRIIHIFSSNKIYSSRNILLKLNDYSFISWSIP